MTTPPDDPDYPEEPGVEQGSIRGFQVPDELEPADDTRQANLFVPEDLEPGEPLNVRVWKITAETMDYQTRRRC